MLLNAPSIKQFILKIIYKYFSHFVYMLFCTKRWNFALAYSLALKSSPSSLHTNANTLHLKAPSATKPLHVLVCAISDG